MPIFEEKLVSPFAVRFSQDHIRPEFQQGCDIEAAIKQIKTKPGSGDYDIVLVAPFPAIEIIRGHLKGGDEDHWLSLDNRRLYCLQRAAVANLPLRAAVEVEALRAPTQGMRKKVNSSVGGLSVGIGHSWHSLVGRWDWHEAVGGVSENPAAHGLAALDDAKASIHDLQDAFAPPSMLDLFFQNEKAGATSDSSTAEPRSPKSSLGSDSTILDVPNSPLETQQQSSGGWMPDIIGVWEDERANTYSVTIAPDGFWTCWRKNPAGSRRKVALWYDEATDSVSWGDDWSCWADASDIRKDGTMVSWFAGRDAAKRKPRFQWWSVQSKKGVSKPSQRSKNGNKTLGA